MSRASNDTFPGDHRVKKIHPPKKTVVIGDGVERLYSRSSAFGWTASDYEAEERQAISSYRSKRLEEASSYFQRKLKMEDDGEDFPIRSLRNVTGPLKEVMLTLFQGPNEVHALEVTTIAMLWQLKYLGAELGAMRDSREDIDNILENFGKLSELQNKAVTRLMNFFKVFDGRFMDVLRKRVTRTEDALPPLWREIEPRPMKSSRP